MRTPDEIKSGTININSVNEGIGKLYCPTSGDDDEDFRNSLDLDGIHKSFDRFGEPPGRLAIKKDAKFLAKLFIKNGAFFNAALSCQIAEIIPVGGAAAVVSSRVGKVYGADLDDERVMIELGASGKAITLDRTTAPYSISIRYKCADTSSVITDFEKFYDVLEKLPAGHLRCDLQYKGWEKAYRHECEKSLLDRCENDEKFKQKIAEDKSLEQLIKNMFLATEACQTSTLPEHPRNLEGIPEF